MSNSTTNKQNSLKFICNIIGHKYQISRKVTYHVKEYTCKCCNKQLTTDGDGNLTELTPKFREINSLLERMYMRRRLRVKQEPYTALPNYPPLQSA